jgi:hypothetical protein
MSKENIIFFTDNVANYSYAESMMPLNSFSRDCYSRNDHDDLNLDKEYTYGFLSDSIFTKDHDILIDLINKIQIVQTWVLTVPVPIGTCSTINFVLFNQKARPLLIYAPRFQNYYPQGIVNNYNFMLLGTNDRSFKESYKLFYCIVQSPIYKSQKQTPIRITSFSKVEHAVIADILYNNNKYNFFVKIAKEFPNFYDDILEILSIAPDNFLNSVPLQQAIEHTSTPDNFFNNLYNIL